MTKGEIIVAIFVAVMGSNGLWAYLQFRAERKASKKKCTLEDLSNKLDKMQEDLDCNSEITVATGRDRLNFLSNSYIDLGYIPKNDYVSYKLLGDAYCKKYNSEVKTRYEWCINNLEVK